MSNGTVPAVSQKPNLIPPEQAFVLPGREITPEAAEVLERRPWWAASALLYLVIAFVCVAMVWASVAEMDISVEARGTLVPEGSVRPVQAPGGGVVQVVLAREGDTVEQGQPLVQLDDTASRAHLTQLRSELAASEEQRERLRAGKALPAEILDKESRIAQLQSDIAAAALATRQTTLTAPASGIVTTLAVHGPGAVVQTGQTVATLAPQGARLVLEAALSNRDSAFVRPGLPVILLLDAFPYQDYGTVAGQVLSVSPDAIADPPRESVYRVTIVPLVTQVRANSHPMAMRPGMTATARIVTEHRSVLDLLFSPFHNMGRK